MAALQAGLVPPANRAMKGHPPKVINRDQYKVWKFMKEFALWKLCNLNNEVMANPFLRVAIALLCICVSKELIWVEYIIVGRVL